MLFIIPPPDVHFRHGGLSPRITGQEAAPRESLRWGRHSDWADVNGTPTLPRTSAASCLLPAVCQDTGVGHRNWETSGIADLLSEAGMSNMEFVLRFTLSHPGLSTTIVGTANPVHLASNIAVAARGPLPADLYEEAKKHLPLPETR
jgi:aryl-alcohol dehydrogenase-like predicted oxidoreductase